MADRDEGGPSRYICMCVGVGSQRAHPGQGGPRTLGKVDDMVQGQGPVQGTWVLGYIGTLPLLWRDMQSDVVCVGVCRWEG